MSYGSHGDTMPVRQDYRASRATAPRLTHAHTVDSTNNNHKYEPGALSSEHRSLSQTSLDRQIKENDMLHSRIGNRKSTGASANPLQFVKSGGTNLAKEAKDTVEVMEKQKEKKKTFETNEEDWQSNLSSWKSKMRKKSSSSLMRAQESEEFVSSLDEDAGKRRSKTFKEMMEEREKRKSGNYSFYPTDDADDDLFSSQKSTDKPLSRDQKAEEEKMAAFGFTRVDDNSVGSRRSFGSKRSETLPNYSSDRYSVSTETVARTSLDDGSSTVTMVTKTERHSDPTHTSLDISKLERISAPKSKGGQRAWAWERKSTSVLEDEDEKKPAIASWARDSEDEDKEANDFTKSSVTSTSSSSSFRGGSATFPRQQSEPVPPPTLTKIPVVHESASGPSSQGFRSARERFEKASAPTSEVTAPKQETVTRSAFRKSYTFTQDDSTRDRFTKDKSTRDSLGVWDTRDGSSTTTEIIHTSTDRVENTTQKPAPSRKLSATDKKHIEKTIKISQKPNHDKGFGFTIKGGKEFGTPIVVERVILGGAADVCELLPGDEIVAINGATVANHYKDSVELVINQAVRLGQIELKIRRSLAKLGVLDREELQLEQEQRQQLELSHTSRGSVSSLDSSTLSPSLSPRPGSVSSPEPPRPAPTVSPRPAATVSPRPAPRPAPRPTSNEQSLQTSQPTEPPKPSPRPTQPPPTAPRPSNISPWKQQQTESVTPPWQRDTVAPPARPVAAPREQLDVENRKETTKDSIEIIVQRSVITEKTPAQEPPQTDVGSFLSAPEAGIPHVSSNASMDSFTSEDFRLEKEVMDQLEQEDLSPQMSFPSMSAPPRPQTPDDDEPPPLPDAPPPPPNWTTFPGEAPNQPVAEELSFDASDLIPASATASERDAIQARLDNLRRKSNFLGQRMEDMEEFKKLKEELATDSRFKDEETEWQRIEKKEHLSTSSLLNRFDALEAAPKPEVIVQEHTQIVHERTQSAPEVKGTDSLSFSRQQEDVLQTLERVGRDCERRQDEIRRENQNKGWKSMEFMHRATTEDDSWNSYRPRTFSDTQEQFERDQERLNKAKEDDLKRAELIETEKQHQEEKMLEKELARQRELEEIKRHRDEERLQRKLEEEEKLRREEEEARKRREQERIRAEKERIKREEEERRQQEAERKKQEAEQRRKEAELKRKEAELAKQREAERKREEFERKLREEEQRKQEEEEKRRREAELLEEKAEQLRQMEERLRREEEKLRLERERIHKEQELEIQRRERDSEQDRSMYHTDSVTLTYNSAPQQGVVEYVQESRTSPSDSENTETLRSESVYSDSPLLRDKRKKEPAIAPKPSIKSDMSVTRRDVMDMNRRPAGSMSASKVYEDTYQYSSTSPQMRVKRETQANRKSWSPDTAANELSFIKKHPDLKPNGDSKQMPMSRQEVLALNRKAFGRKEYASEGQQEEPPVSPTITPQPMSRKALHSLGAAPKSRLMNSQQWIRDEPQPRRSEVIRQSLPILGDHWLIEEAERQRIAEQRGQDRTSAIPSNRQGYNTQEYNNQEYNSSQELNTQDYITQDILAPPHGYDMSHLSRSWQGSREQTPQRPSPTRSMGSWDPVRHPSPPRSNFSYSQKQSNMSTFKSGPTVGVTHITEIERPEYLEKPQRPIPDDIKQNLLDRVHHGGRSIHPSQLSPTYAYPHSALSSNSSLFSSQPLYPSSEYSDRPVPRDRPPARHHPSPRDHPSPRTVPAQDRRPASAHYPHPAYRPDPRPTPTGPLGGHYPPIARPDQLSDPDAASSASLQSWERAPPVPPKPPRLMSSSDSEESASFVETVVSLV